MRESLEPYPNLPSNDRQARVSIPVRALGARVAAHLKVPPWCRHARANPCDGGSHLKKLQHHARTPRAARPLTACRWLVEARTLCVILLSSVAAADHRELAGRNRAAAVVAAVKGLMVSGHHRAQKKRTGLLREQPNYKNME